MSESLLIQYTLQHATPSALLGLKIAIFSPGSPVRSQTGSHSWQPTFLPNLQPFPSANPSAQPAAKPIALPSASPGSACSGRLGLRPGEKARREPRQRGESRGEGQGEGQRRGKCRKVENFGRNCNKVEKIQKISLSLALRIRLIKVKQWSLSSENTRQGLTTRDDWYFQPPSGLPWRREVI